MSTISVATASLEETRRLIGPRSVRVRRRLPRWLGAMLRVPLAAKLTGASAVVVLTALAAAVAIHGTGPHERQLLAVMVGALVASLLLDLGLVRLALRPLRELERAASSVSAGDLAARVVPSPIADRRMARIGRTVNGLLDELTSDRARMRMLAAQVITAQDTERSRIARELHDSTAQTLAAVVLQLSAAARDSADPALAEHLGMIRELASGALDEVRSLSHVVYPRVLEDLGLTAALEWLARQVRDAEGVDAAVQSGVRADAIPSADARVLYRVAQEAIANAVRHGRPSLIRLRVDANAAQATLEVYDDGCGFDVAAAEARRPGMGLFAMRERVALVNGRLSVRSAQGHGTTVTATVPVTE